ncbi:MAG: hypothetical protein ACKVOM_06915 [Ferruginibacter sp.]
MDEVKSKIAAANTFYKEWKKLSCEDWAVSIHNSKSTKRRGRYSG